MTIDLLTAGGITAAGALILSLLFILFPPLRRRFVALEAETQQALIGLLIIGIAVVAVVLGCAGVVIFIPCTPKSIVEYAISVVFVAVLGDRVSKSTFAAARWWDARAERNAAIKSLTLRDGRLLR